MASTSVIVGHRCGGTPRQMGNTMLQGAIAGMEERGKEGKGTRRLLTMARSSGGAWESGRGSATTDRWWRHRSRERWQRCASEGECGRTRWEGKGARRARVHLIYAKGGEREGRQGRGGASMAGHEGHYGHQGIMQALLAEEKEAKRWSRLIMSHDRE